MEESNFKVKHGASCLARRMEQIIGNKESCTTIFQLIFKSNKLKKFPLVGGWSSSLFREELSNLLKISLDFPSAQFPSLNFSSRWNVLSRSGLHDKFSAPAGLVGNLFAARIPINKSGTAISSPTLCLDSGK